MTLQFSLSLGALMTISLTMGFHRYLNWLHAKQNGMPGERTSNWLAIINDHNPPISGIIKLDHVPNIVHYIWFPENPHNNSLDFRQYLSILSVHKFIRPNHIYFHTNDHPGGFYWNLAEKIPEFKVVHRNPAKNVLGHNITFTPWYPQIVVDLERLLVLLEYGGIYFDLDVIALKSFSSLLQYDTTLGLENQWKICAGVIVSRPNAAFLKIWLHGFITDLKPAVYAYNSGIVSKENYHQVSNIRRTKSQHLKYSRTVFAESLEARC